MANRFPTGFAVVAVGHRSLGAVPHCRLGRVAAAQARADEADTRAQVASARAANVLAAVEAMGGDLDQVVQAGDPRTTERVRVAVDRLAVAAAHRLIPGHTGHIS